MARERAQELEEKFGKENRFQYDCLDSKYGSYVACEMAFRKDKDQAVRKSCKENALFDSFACLR